MILQHIHTHTPAHTPSGRGYYTYYQCYQVFDKGLSYYKYFPHKSNEFLDWQKRNINQAKVYVLFCQLFQKK